MSAKTLPRVISSKFDQSQGKGVWRENLRLVSLAADRVRSSFGPLGSYKMITYNRGPERVVKITKDAVAVLDELAIQYPLLKVLSEAAKIQRAEIGDGATSFVLLTSSLLKRADKMISIGIHPSLILDGYREATKKALELTSNESHEVDDASARILETVDCRRGLLTGRMSAMLRKASELVTEQGKMKEDRIRITKVPGVSVSESELIQGVVLKKEKTHPGMPDIVEKPRIAVLSGRLGSNRVEVKMKSEGAFPIKLSVEDPKQLSAYRQEEKELKMHSIRRLKAIGANVLLCEQPIDDFSKSQLESLGFFAVESLTKDDAEEVAYATNSNVVSDASVINEKDLGEAAKLEVKKIGNEKMLILDGCRGAAFLLRGATIEAIEELETCIKSSIMVLKNASLDSRVVNGGGAIEMQIAKELRKFSREFPNRKALAIEAYADALVELPTCLAENYGLSPVDTVLQLTKAHTDGLNSCGISEHGCHSDVCVELAITKNSVLKRALEVATLLLRIDEQIVFKEPVKFHKK